MSTIFSNFSNTDFLALNGNLCNVSIFFNTYIHRSKSVSHSCSSLVKEGNSKKMKRSLSENASCVSLSERTISVRNLCEPESKQKFMKNTPYTALSRNCQSAPRSP